MVTFKLRNKFYKNIKYFVFIVWPQTIFESRLLYHEWQIKIDFNISAVDYFFCFYILLTITTE